MKQSRKLLRSSFIVILFFGLNKVTGFVRLLLVGDAFGTGPEMDAFTAANQLPELFYVLVAGGALAAALIPVYSQYLVGEKAKDRARLANTILTLVIAVLGGICVVAAIAAPFITRTFLVPSFSAEQQKLTADLMRIILINTTLFGISGVLSSLLNAHQHFALPALAPVALDIGYFVGVRFFVPEMGIHGLAWGTVVGALLHIGIQVPALIRYRLGYRPRLAVALPGVREIVRLMGPRIVMLGAIQFADIFIINFGSQLPDGSISGYNYAFTLMQLPETLFGTAIAIVVFPTLARLFNAGDVQAMKRLALRSLRIIWLLTIPAGVGLVLLGRPAISFILQRGEFDAASTAVVYAVLVFFSVRIVSEASLEILARMFYARHNTFTPMLAYMVWAAVNITFIFLTVRTMGVRGLALSSTIAFTVLSGLLFALNRKELGDMEGGKMARTLGRAVFSAAIMTIAILAVGQLGLGTFAFLGVATPLGVLVYGATLFLLGGEEIDLLKQLPATLRGDSNHTLG